jgi:hypothetical protein
MTASLYRHFNASGDLLYVGIAICPFKRLKAHTRSIWYSEVRTVTIELFASKELARDAEREAIKKDCPLFNVLRPWEKFITHESTNIEKAINNAGGVSALASLISVTPQSIVHWRNRGIPAKRVLDIERVTGISRHELRPDIYGQQ